MITLLKAQSDYIIWLVLLAICIGLFYLFSFIRMKRTAIMRRRIADISEDEEGALNRKCVIVRILFSISSLFLGSALLCLLSALQKTISGFSLAPSGFIIPFVFGGISGLIIGLFLNRIIQQRESMKLLNENLDKRNQQLEEMINEVTTINIELEAAKVRAEASDRLKSAFLANISHEIRTPMNGILGFVDLLEKSDINTANIGMYSEAIQKSSERMINTINDLVNISLIESGQMSLNVKRLVCATMLEDLFEYFSKDAKEKKIEYSLEFNKKDFSGKEYYSDQDKVQMILAHLLKNAFKYTNEGGKVVLGCRPSSEFIEYYVKDSGAGIPLDRQKHIFNSFEKAEEDYHIVDDGCGLGLAISKAYVDILQGEIWLESDKGKGSSFYFKIPSL